MKKLINSHNKVNHTVHVADVSFGTRFDVLCNQLLAAGYVNGWNKTDNGWVWFKTVGCHGYVHILVTKELRKSTIDLAKKLRRSPKNIADLYWNYRPGEKETCDRNLRLWSENKVKFLAHLVEQS